MLPFPPVATKPPIFTPTFFLLSAATLCFFASFGILVPALPRYMDSLGFRPFELGIVLGAFSLSAIVLRPVVGREIDRRSRKLFAVLGIALSAVACFAYAFAASLATLIGVRLLHGFAIASFYPGASTFTADIAPPTRRAEALSYFSMFLYGGNAIGPAAGDYLVGRYSFDAAFAAAGLLGLAGLAFAAMLREPERPPWEGARGPLVHRAAIFPATVLGLAAIAWAAIGYVPLYVAGTSGSGLFFITLSITVLLLRPFVGKAADRFGRAAVIVPGTFIASLAMLIVATSPSRAAVFAGALAFGVGWGALFPGLLALTIDRVPANQRGSATGTFTAAFDLSFGFGSALLGLVLQLTNFSTLFLAAATGAFAAGVVFLAVRGRSERSYPAARAT